MEPATPGLQGNDLSIAVPVIMFSYCLNVTIYFLGRGSSQLTNLEKEPCGHTYTSDCETPGKIIEVTM